MRDHLRSSAHTLAAEAASGGLPEPPISVGRLLERLSDAFVAFDGEWRYTFVNQAAERFLGHPRQRLLGQVVFAVTPELSGPSMQEMLRAAAAQQRPEHREDYFPGSGRWYALHAYPSTDGLSLLLEDITERKSADAERDRRIGDLEAERALLDEVIQQMPGGVAIVEAPTGHLLTLNRAAERLWPADADEPGNWPVQRVLRGGEEVAGEEVVRVGRDGRRRVLSVNAGPVRNLAGQVVAGVVTLQDVTDQRQQEARERLLGQIGEILNSSLDYAATVQGVAQLCASSLAEYCIVHVEDGGEIRALGIAHRDPAKVESVREVLRLFPVDPQEERHPVVEVMRRGRARLLADVDETILERFTGGSPHLARMRSLGLSSVLLVPLTARGSTLGSISLARTGDLPAYEQADLALVEELARRAALAVDNARLYREAQREAEARERTLGLVSHDLRNSLNAAVMQAELLLDVPEERLAVGGGRRQMEALRRALDHMHRLVQDLVDVESIESGRFSLHPRVLDAASVGAEVQEMFAPLARERGLALEVELSDALPRVLGDHVRIVQVFSNLILNAMDHTPPGGRVVLEADRLEGGVVRFRVRDTGVGISPADLSRVFDKHWRGKTSLRHHAGSGLGLAIVRGIVLAHGGEVWVESRSGQGSVFSFTLPVAPDAAA